LTIVKHEWWGECYHKLNLSCRSWGYKLDLSCRSWGSSEGADAHTYLRVVGF
jgi:hypothetical protein